MHDLLFLQIKRVLVLWFCSLISSSLLNARIRMCFSNEYIVFLVFDSVIYYEQIVIYTCCYIYWNNHYGALQVLIMMRTMNDEARSN